MVKKLNKSSKPYQIKEEVSLKSGLYESALAHDNIVDGSVVVVGSNGLPITTYTLEKNKEKDWETIIRIQSNVDKATIHYETFGDTVDADDLNDLNDKIDKTAGNISTTKDDVEKLKQSNKDNAENINKLDNQHRSDLETVNSSISKLDTHKASKDDLQADKIEYSPGWSVYEELGRKATQYQLEEGLKAKAELSHKHQINDVSGLNDTVADIWKALNGKAFTSHTHTPSQVYLNSEGDTLDQIKAKHIDYDGWDTVEGKLKALQAQIDAGGGGGSGTGDVLSVNGKTGIVRLTSEDIPHDKRTVFTEINEHDKRLETNESKLSFMRVDIDEANKDIDLLDTRVKTLEENGGGGSSYVIPRTTAVPLNNEISIKEETKKALEYQIDSIDDTVTQDSNRFKFNSTEGYSNLSLSIAEGKGAFKLAFKEVAGYYSYTHYRSNGDKDTSGWIKTTQVVTFDVEKGERITISTGNTLVVQVENIPTTTVKKLIFEGKAINDDPDFSDINKDIADLKSSVNNKVGSVNGKTGNVVLTGEDILQNAEGKTSITSILESQQLALNFLMDDMALNDNYTKPSLFKGDMDDLVDMGRYYVADTASNKPGAGGWFVDVYVANIQNNGQLHKYQVAYKMTGDKNVYARNQFGGKWTDWQRVDGRNKADKADVEQLREEIEKIGGGAFHDAFPNTIKESTAPNEFSQGITLCWQSLTSNFPTIGESGVSITFIGSRINYGQIFITDNGDMWSRRSGVKGSWNGEWYNAKKEIDKKANTHHTHYAHDIFDNTTHETQLEINKAVKEDIDSLKQSGVESNKTLVDALNSMSISASTSDTIKTNANKVRSITNNGSLNRTISMQNGSVNVSPGYYSGGQVKANITNLTSSNIRKGVNVGGVVGTFTIKKDYKQNITIGEHSDYKTTTVTLPLDARIVSGTVSGGDSNEESDYWCVYDVNTGKLINGGDNTFLDSAIKTEPNKITIKTFGYKNYFKTTLDLVVEID